MLNKVKSFASASLQRRKWLRCEAWNRGRQFYLCCLCDYAWQEAEMMGRNAVLGSDRLKLLARLHKAVEVGRTTTYTRRTSCASDPCMGGPQSSRYASERGLSTDMLTTDRIRPLQPFDLRAAEPRQLMHAHIYQHTLGIFRV